MHLEYENHYIKYSNVILNVIVNPFLVKVPKRPFFAYIS